MRPISILYKQCVGTACGTQMGLGIYGTTNSTDLARISLWIHRGANP